MDIHTKHDSTDFGPLAEWYANRSSPRNQFTLRSNYNITPKIEFDNILYYVSSLPDARQTARNSTVGAIPSYYRFDTRVAYFPVKNLELSLVGQNLTDERHQEFSQGLYNNQTEVGRTFYFKAVLGF
jgi:iron complex outermembrane receptor protein